MLEVDRKAEIEVLSSAVAATTNAGSPAPSQRSQGLPWIALGSQLSLGSQEEHASGERPPPQLMQYLFDRIGARLAAEGEGDAE